MNASRYLRIVRWAAKRYTDRNGFIVTYHGLNPAPYKRIEIAAWNRYMG
jgi:hypothetical protein